MSRSFGHAATEGAGRGVTVLGRRLASRSMRPPTRNSDKIARHASVGELTRRAPGRSCDRQGHRANRSPVERLVIPVDARPVAPTTPQPSKDTGRVAAGAHACVGARGRPHQGHAGCRGQRQRPADPRARGARHRRLAALEPARLARPMSLEIWSARACSCLARRTHSSASKAAASRCTSNDLPHVAARIGGEGRSIDNQYPRAKYGRV